MAKQKDSNHPEAETSTEEFVSLTGNPENGDYLDYYRHLEKTGQLDK